MPQEALLAQARAGDAEARRQLVELATLRVARVAMGDSAKDKHDTLRELARGEGPVPGLGVLLCGIARGDDGELRRAIELVIRAGQRRWGPPERAAVAAVVERHGARLGADLALNVAEWAAEYPDDLRAIARGIAPALAQAGADDVERFGWHRGFQDFVIRERATPLVAETWSASPPHAKQVAKALFAAQASGHPGVIDALDEIWRRTRNRNVWTRALGEQTRGHHGMSHRDEIVAWSWGRFCAYADERAALHEAFASWRDLWVELRNKMPARARPGGASALAHLALWGGLDITHLSNVIGEVQRLARDDEWAALVDATFDLASAAPHDLQRHALAGACRIASEVANRIRGGDASPGLDAGGDRVIARGEALARELRESGAVIDEILANRANDLELEARLIREKREREVERAHDAAERAAEQARRQAESARRQAEIDLMKAQTEAARLAAEQARRQAEIDLRARLATTAPGYLPQAIDSEVFFASLPVPSLFAYARMFRRMSTGGVQSLAADGVTLEMLAVINQTWSALFSQRPELALRFSVLISTVPPS